MIIDAFLFYQEYDMLEFRLKLLYPYVDRFIIVEADKTFSGMDKSFNYEQHKQRYAWAEDKITYFKLHCDVSSLNLTDKPRGFQPNHDCWQIEYTQRGAIIAACNNFADDDILLMGDVDEIPSLDAIEWAKNNIRLLPVVCQQYSFYYNLRRLRQEMCLTSIFSTLRTARSLGTQELRNRRNILTRIGNSGWHLSYFDSADKIQKKIEAFSHQELNLSDFKSEEHINHCLDDGQDLFNRDVKTTATPADLFPVYFREQAKLYKWGLIGPSEDKTPEDNNTAFRLISDGSQKAKVSLTMIVRNEEYNLPRCLESVQGLFDEIVVVDTGSVDSTKEIAAKYGAKVVDFAWIDDFSTARNVSLANATGDYAFWLDADDVVTALERKKLETLLKNLPTDRKEAYVMRCASDRESNSQIVVDHVRLFPLLESVRWTYRVHEQILPALTQARIPVHWTDITVLHKGYVDASTKERKRQRDWDILQKELASLPDDSFVLYNLRMIAFERQQWQEALEYFQCSYANLLQSAALESLRRKLSGMLAWTYQLLGNLEESLRVCEEGLSIEPEDAELWFRKAVAYRYQRKTIEAEACWRHILTLRRPEKFCSIDQGIYGHLTRRNLAIIAGERGHHQDAQIYWQVVLTECPNDPDAMRNLKMEIA